MTAECPRCHGDGEIEINPSRINDPQCAEPMRCPDCHGTGVTPESEQTHSTEED
jgi:DnaJ-class molecular chaperone